MTQDRYGISFNDSPVPLWVYALPRAEGRLPEETNGRQWRWLRLDRITQVMTELAVGDPADESGQYMVTITADGEQYHPTSLLIKDEEIDAAELYVIEYVNRSLAVLAKGRKN
ncbi:hypothetical protein QYZ29_21555 [Xanthomonas campestris pv. campestris]|uniref:hypothetical protein n=1 Tax=Xanthomonas campestris TaxID=339 RepID=UPI000839140A|nr:hypothetical protein [Xanthomonas campestris]MCF8838430.1 hypothetical protein [Xanthomonas campestris pv. campestris]MCF8865808.1 hypothetical protein [Xanthomonas campestris pv. campestris]MDO0882921.1 hypothetical protein [Xanthomonas campestris pv. campestris]MEA0635185.1 hypothetical protein [Xanthomonas campestris pv. campestris]MEA0651578.1 hypothetical protein [Xanthomonas campestris pv. campestris]